MLGWFLGIAFGVAWVLFLLPIAFGPVGSPERQMASLIAWSAAMWAPGAAALITTRWVAGDPWSVLNLRHLGPKRPYLWAFFLPPVLTGLTFVLTIALDAANLDTEFSVIRQSVSQASGQAISPALLVALQVGLALTLAPFFNALFAGAKS